LFFVSCKGTANNTSYSEMQLAGGENKGNVLQAGRLGGKIN
jgi:hypothetical protein